ncbi:hypothetical protein ACFOKI_07260 [Sphingomonas qilianensis]|uniref:Haloacid dehalogenase-like hydrolase n=1 Tax=Sphingomonas qilianensis TaxID=1736690 RepID=A0ABU9XSG7_9SPHN
MPTESDLLAFREQARGRHQANSWVAQAEQDQVLRGLLGSVSDARVAGLRPVVCVDLDLTTLLAPAKSVDVLMQLVPTITEMPVSPRCAEMIDLLAAIWRGEQDALLPGYTSSAIAAYGVFMAACLEARTGLPFDQDRDACETWIASSVHGQLRNGYWNRDVERDAFSPGFSGFASELVAAGATIVFLSNRDPSLRAISLASLSGLLAGAAPIFAFFGPGGSPFDASSKAVAVQWIEAGVGAGVHFGRAVDGQTVFDEAALGGMTGEPQAIVAVIDDRAENRHQIVAAAIQSAARLNAVGLPPPREMACAAPGFCPEIEIVSTADALSSFIVGEQ